jgi:uncharacterized protein YecE (DUF72 family)
VGSIHVGMSGFSYPEWIGDFYPQGTKREHMLARYADRFDAVEINMTFRRRPQEKILTTWRDAVPPEFRFALKGNAGVTHYRRLKDPGEPVASFMASVGTLGDRLGAVLYQTPANVAFEPDVLDAFLGVLPRAVPHAFEPRHESFEDPAVDELLAKHGVARCVNDDVVDLRAYRVTGPIAYFRFHKVGYEPGDLASRAELARSLAAQGTEVYAFFAHEDNPASTRPALDFRELVRV